MRKLREILHGLTRMGLVVTAAALLVTMGLYATLRTADLLGILPGLSLWLGDSATTVVDAAGIGWLALGLALVLAEAAVQRRMRLWNEMARDARRIVEVSDHQRVSEGRDEPVVHIARALNHLVDRLKKSELHRQRETTRADALQKAAAQREAYLKSTGRDIRTSLTAMLGFAENMAEAELSQQARFEAVQLVRRNGDKLTQIVDALLKGPNGPDSVAADATSEKKAAANTRTSTPSKARVSATSAAPGGKGAPSKNGAAGAAGKLSGRVLLAEDCADNARIVSAILERAGLKVQTAHNGQIACELALRQLRDGRPYDVILMDLNMPVLDGCDAARLLRSEGYQGPILALTASTDTCDRGRCVRAGCTAFTTKPVERDALLRTVAALIPQRAAVASA